MPKSSTLLTIPDETIDKIITAISDKRGLHMESEKAIRAPLRALITTTFEACGGGNGKSGKSDVIDTARAACMKTLNALNRQDVSSSAKEMIYAAMDEAKIQWNEISSQGKQPEIAPRKPVGQAILGRKHLDQWKTVEEETTEEGKVIKKTIYLEGEIMKEMIKEYVKEDEIPKQNDPHRTLGAYHYVRGLVTSLMSSYNTGNPTQSKEIVRNFIDTTGDILGRKRARLIAQGVSDYIANEAYPKKSR